MSVENLDYLQPELPEGYQFVERDAVNPQEIMDLRAGVGWRPDSYETWGKGIASSLVFVAVKAQQDGPLVGMARVSGSEDLRHGVMADFCVDLKHRNKGIGMAIAKKRLLTLENEVKVQHLYGKMSLQNHTAPLLKQAGFVVDGAHIFRARPSRSE